MQLLQACAATILMISHVSYRYASHCQTPVTTGHTSRTIVTLEHAPGMHVSPQRVTPRHSECATQLCVCMCAQPPPKQLEHVQLLSDFQDLPRYVQLRAVQILRMHVMGNVRQRIEAGHRDFVNEIRVCTCLFLGFPSLKVIPPIHKSVLLS